MYISEPWTFITDILLALFSFYFANRILQDPQSRLSTSYRLWFACFLMIGAAALQGALYHGFSHALPPKVHLFLRIGTLCSLSATAFFLSLSTLRFSCPRHSPVFSWIFGVILLKAFFFASLAATQTKFLFAILDYGSAFVVALVVFGLLHKRSGAKGMVLGILVSMIAALIQALQISPSESFNHNDLYHVVQLLGLFIFYKSTPRLNDHGSLNY